MKRYTVPLADFDPGERHVNREGMIPADARTAGRVVGFLRSNGVEASETDSSNTVTFAARNKRAASRTAFAVMCHLASESYRAEAVWWIANRDAARDA
jgi:hypothetical protein